MWDNCVLTKFVGNVDSAGMTKDIHFAWKPFKSHQDHYFTRNGARDLALILFVFAAGGLNIVCMLKEYQRKSMQPIQAGPSLVTLPFRAIAGRLPDGVTSPGAEYLRKRLLPAIAGAAVVAGICYALLPKLGNSEVHASHSYHSEFEYALSFAIDEQLQERPEVLAGTESEIADFLLRNLRDRMKDESPMPNGITGAELQVEDSPGNFTIEKQAGKVIVRVYGRFGTAIVKTYPIEATDPTQHGY